MIAYIGIVKIIEIFLVDGSRTQYIAVVDLIVHILSINFKPTTGNNKQNRKLYNS